MRVVKSAVDSFIINSLRTGGVGVLRTDTVYGIICLAKDEVAVERVFKLKGRDAAKSPIVLIEHLDQMYDTPSESELRLAEDFWPGPVTIIHPSTQSPLWIRRGNDSVAYRMPAERSLIKLLSKVGPLIAPSANPQGEPPARTIREAINYFGESVDFYVDGGEVLITTPSRIVRITEHGGIEYLR